MLDARRAFKEESGRDGLRCQMIDVWLPITNRQSYPRSWQGRLLMGFYNCAPLRSSAAIHLPISLVPSCNIPYFKYVTVPRTYPVPTLPTGCSIAVAVFGIRNSDTNYPVLLHSQAVAYGNAYLRYFVLMCMSKKFLTLIWAEQKNCCMLSHVMGKTKLLSRKRSPNEGNDNM